MTSTIEPSETANSIQYSYCDNNTRCCFCRKGSSLSMFNEIPRQRSSSLNISQCESVAGEISNRWKVLNKLINPLLVLLSSWILITIIILLVSMYTTVQLYSYLLVGSFMSLISVSLTLFAGYMASPKHRKVRSQLNNSLKQASRYLF